MGDYLFEPVVINILVAASALVTPQTNRVPVRLINPSNAPKRIPKKTAVGYLQEAIDIPNTYYSIVNSEMTDVHVFSLRTSVNDLCSDFTDENQTHSVKNEYRHVSGSKMPEVVLEVPQGG